MLFYILFGLLLVIQIWDVWCSYDILTKHGSEKNLLVQWFISKLGVIKGLLAAKLLFVAPAMTALFYFQNHPYAVPGLAVLNIYYLVILRSYIKRSI